jgi:alkylhydroperoxidase family enzyme
MSRHDAAIDAVCRSVLAGADATRQAAFDGTPLPPPIGDFVAKVRGDSTRMRDADVAALRAAGLDEDAILELTLAAAVGAGLEELRAARER